jgi:hypothetical protein
MVLISWYLQYKLIRHFEMACEKNNRIVEGFEVGQVQERGRSIIKDNQYLSQRRISV